MGKYDDWEEVYRRHSVEALPWELGKPRDVLVNLIQDQRIITKGKALDICCGLGTNTIFLAQSGFETAGMDISKTAIEKAIRKSQQIEVSIDFRVGNALNLPFENEEFDFILDMGCFHHIRPEDRKQFIEGILRVLKKQGHYFMICFSNKNGLAWNHFSKESIMTIFSPYFYILDMEHHSSVEGDGFVRYFYAALMLRR